MAAAPAMLDVVGKMYAVPLVSITLVRLVAIGINTMSCLVCPRLGTYAGMPDWWL